MKIHIHNIYITYKIVYKSAADSSNRSREITIFKKVKKILLKFVDQSFSPKNSAESYPKSTSTMYFNAMKSILLP